MRRLALLLALLLAPQTALAGVAAFPESALRVDREISGRRAEASARQVAEGRLEKAYFYGESASAIVDDPINHRDPTGEQVPPSGARPPRVPSMQLNLLSPRVALQARMSRALEELEPARREFYRPSSIGQRSIEELESSVRRAEFEAVMARVARLSPQEQEALAPLFNIHMMARLPLPQAVSDDLTRGGCYEPGAGPLALGPGAMPLGLAAPRTATQLRNGPGMATGTDLPVIVAGQRWLRGNGQDAARLPRQIAERLAGRSFDSFRELREAIWREVAADPVLSMQFGPNSLREMQAGRAPWAPPGGRIGGRAKYELDHLSEIQNGGSVFDLTNLVVRTPVNHVGK